MSPKWQLVLIVAGMLLSGPKGPNAFGDAVGKAVHCEVLWRQEGMYCEGYMNAGDIDGNGTEEVASAFIRPGWSAWHPSATRIVVYEEEGTPLCDTGDIEGIHYAHILVCPAPQAAVYVGRSQGATEIDKLDLESCERTTCGGLGNWVDTGVKAQLNDTPEKETVWGTWGGSKAYDSECNELWSCPHPSHSGGPVDAADLDSDGYDEIIIGCWDLDGNLYAIQEDGTVYWIFTPETIQAFISGLAVDSDGDGRLEVLVWQWPSGVCYLLEGDGTKRWGPIQLGIPLGVNHRRHIIAEATPRELYFYDLESKEILSVETATGNVLKRVAVDYETIAPENAAVGHIISGSEVHIAFPQKDTGLVYVYDSELNELGTFELPFSGDLIRFCQAELDGDGVYELIARGGTDIAALKLSLGFKLALTSREAMECEGEFELFVELTNPEEIQAFSFGLEYDPEVLELVAVDWEDCPVMEALNEGAGPSVFLPNLEPSMAGCSPETKAGLTVGCVTSTADPIGEVIPKGTDQRIVRLVFQIRSGAPVGTVTALHFSDCLGDPPAKIALTVECKTVRPEVEGGSVKVMPSAFRRAEVNRDCEVDISDAVTILVCLLVPEKAPEGQCPLPCMDAGDVNDDGRVDIADPIYLLQYLFAEGPKPPEPFEAMGSDPTQDELDCKDCTCAR